MKVSELIEALSKFSGDSEVIVYSYIDEGADECYGVRQGNPRAKYIGGEPYDGDPYTKGGTCAEAARTDDYVIVGAPKRDIQ